MGKIDDLLTAARLPWNHNCNVGFASRSSFRGSQNQLTLPGFVHQPNVNLKELIASAPRKKLEELTHLVSNEVANIAETEEHCGEVLSEAGAVAVNYISVATEVCAELMEISEPGKLISSHLPELAQSLHDMMFDLEAPDAIKVQGSISRICETWFLKNFPDRDHLAPQMLSYLLVMCSDPTQAKAVYLKRLWQVRQALRALDLDDPDSAHFRDHLLRAYVTPQFLRHLDGRKLLSFFFSLSSSMVQSAHQVIKGQLPQCRASLIDVYADVYFRAWRDIAVGTTGSAAAVNPNAPEASVSSIHDAQIQHLIETACIQDLMDLAIHSRNQANARIVQSVLRLGFHKNKIQHKPYVDSLLYRLYTPIIWRALKAANSAVRRNAISLFVDAFPLSNPDGPAHETETLLHDQFQQLIRFLEDPDIAVRARATEGVSHVLKEWWELLPSNIVKALLTRLITELAFDASSVAVRAAVLDGLGNILDNPLSHSALKIMLPKLAPLLHDRSERVQCSMLNLLLSIKRLRTIRFFDVVDVDDVILRLAECTTPVAIRISQLLLNSFFPQGKTPAETLHRALTFIKKNPVAARSFFERVHTLVPAKQVLNLVYLLYRFMLQHVDTVLGIASKTDKAENENEELEVSESLAVQVLVTMVRMWDSVRAYRTDVELQDYMLSAFKDRGLERILAVYGENASARVAVMAMSAKLPLECSPQLAEIGVSHLTLFPDDTPDVEFVPIVNCLFAWKQHSEALRLIYEGICRGLGVQVESKESNQVLTKKGKRGAKGTEPEPENKMSPTLACRFYSHFWADTRIRSILLSKPQVCDNIESLVDKLFSDIQDELNELVINRRVGVTVDNKDKITDDIHPSTREPVKLRRETTPEGNLLSAENSDEPKARSGAEYFIQKNAKMRSLAISQRLRFLLGLFDAYLKSALHQLNYAIARREELVQVTDSSELADEAVTHARRMRQESKSSLQNPSEDSEDESEEEDYADESPKRKWERGEEYRVSQLQIAENTIRDKLRRLVNACEIVTQSAIPICSWCEFFDEAEAQREEPKKPKRAKTSDSSETEETKASVANEKLNRLSASVSKRDLATSLVSIASRLLTEALTIGLVPSTFASYNFVRWANAAISACKDAKQQLRDAHVSSFLYGLSFRPLPILEDTFLHSLAKGVLQMGSSTGSVCRRVAFLAAEAEDPKREQTPVQTTSDPPELEARYIEEQGHEAIKQMCLVTNESLTLTSAAFDAVPAVIRVTLLETLRLVSGTRTGIITMVALLLQQSASQLAHSFENPSLILDVNLPALGVITQTDPEIEIERKSHSDRPKRLRRGRSSSDDAGSGEDMSDDEDVQNYSEENKTEAKRRASLVSIPSDRSNNLIEVKELTSFLLLAIAKTPVAAFALPEAVSSLINAKYPVSELPSDEWSKEDSEELASRKANLAHLESTKRKVLLEDGTLVNMDDSMEEDAYDIQVREKARVLVQELERRLNDILRKADLARTWTLIHLLAHLCHLAVSLVRYQSQLRRVTNAIASAVDVCLNNLKSKVSEEEVSRYPNLVKSAEMFADDIKFTADAV